MRNNSRLKILWIFELVLWILTIFFVGISFKQSESIATIKWTLPIIPFALFIMCSVLIMRSEPGQKERKFFSKIFPVFIASVLLVIATLMIIGFFILHYNYSETTMLEVMWLLHADMGGANISGFYGVIVIGVAIIAALVAIFLTANFRFAKARKDTRFVAIVLLTSLVINLIGGLLLYKQLCVGDYFYSRSQYSDFIEDNFVDGEDVVISFKEKRNVIFIYLESMEITFSGKENGGATASDYIPELTRIAYDNIDFGNKTVLNGGHALYDSTYTMGAMAAMTAGIGVNRDFFSDETTNEYWNDEDYDEDWLPFVYTFGEALQDNGYNQELLIGSDANFGGRAPYFRNHGNYYIFDYFTAKERGYIPEDYYVWWGFEDQKLFDYAKKDILNLAAQNKPFNFTMLTVDTHFKNGYVCDLCGNEFENQYSNVYACSSKQVAEFIDWIKQQPFYENTTIVLAGDHPTMDTKYTDAEKIPGDYDRKTYFVILNPADGCENTDRVYSTYDVYPTTLAAMGATIEGNRLGLGVNLFSDEPTILEEYGYDYVQGELAKHSLFYERGMAGHVHKDDIEGN